MTRGAMLVIAVLIVLQGCTGMNVAMISERDAKGRDVDQVVAELKARGFSCGKEYIDKDVVTRESFGRVVCSTKETALFCPSNYLIYVSFNLNTRVVQRLTKNEKQHCF